MEVEIVLFENLCFADCVFEKTFFIFRKMFFKTKNEKIQKKKNEASFYKSNDL